MPQSVQVAIGANTIRQLDGLYSLNDLHTAAGSEAKHQPALFLRLDSTQALVTEISNSTEKQSYVSKSGRTGGGTYACRELVIAYAAWISPSFHLQVIRVFLATKPQSPALERSKGGSRSLPEDVEAAISERVWDLIRIYSETLRQDIRARVLCEPARAFDIINSANLTDSLIPAQTRELRHIARLLDALLKPKHDLAQRETMP